MTKFLLFLMISFCVVFSCAAQNYTNQNKNSIILQIDSLNQIVDNLRKTNLDSALLLTEKVDLLATSISYKEGKGIALKNKALIFFYKGKYEESLTVVEESILLLEQTDNKIELAASYGLKGHLKEQVGETDAALQNHNKAIASLKSVTDSDVSLKLAIAYNLLGIHYQRGANHTEALKCFTNSFSLVENQDQPMLLSAFLSNIGNTHLYQKEYEKAVPYYEKTIAIQEKVNDKAGLSVSYNNMGAALLSLNKDEKAISYLQKSAQIYKEAGNTRGYILTQMNIGIVYYNKDDYDKAKKYLKECLELKEEIIDKNTLTSIYVNLAACENEQQNYDSAIIHAQKGLEIAKSIDAKNVIIDCLQTISIAYKGNRNFEKAYEYQLLHTTYKDSLFNIEKASEVNALLLDQKELENLRLEKDNIVKQNTLQKERLEKQAQSQSLLILEKQAEADKLLALARESKNKQEADSLYRAAKTAQLEADNLNIKAQKAEAEKRAAEAENKEKIGFQKNISIIFGIGILAALLIAYTAYRGQKSKQKANLLLAEKNEEIYLQNELLEQSNATKNHLFSIIAHDLKSPITAFQGITEQIKFFLRKDKPERLLQMTQNIDQSVENLNELLTNLLNWALTQTEQISLNKQTINIHNNIEEAINIYQMKAVIEAIELENKSSKELSVYVDKDSFQTILRNIIGNAIKYTPQNGKISIWTETKRNKENEENNITLFIADTGVGISPEMQQRLFELNVGNTTRGVRGEKGTGLGLVLSYQFAKLNEIDIQIRTKLNEGTTFILTIPTTTNK